MVILYYASLNIYNHVHVAYKNKLCTMSLKLKRTIGDYFFPNKSFFSIIVNVKCFYLGIFSTM